MRKTEDRLNNGTADYDRKLADRIKSILREDESDALPQKLETGVEIQLLSNEIMKGGLGRVGRYWDEDLEREVAVKFIHQGLESTHGQRFQREIMITSSLDHPGVVPIYNVGQSQGNPYYTMRFVSGQTFAEAVQQFHRSANNELDRGNPQFRALLESFKSACATIGYAHREKHVWHRDVKPQNIMIENGLTVVLDWGLAKRKSGDDESSCAERVASKTEDLSCLTSANQYLGSPAYMAPEQATGNADQIDNLTDIYGLGATLFELLTGQAPHQWARGDAETRKTEYSTDHSANDFCDGDDGSPINAPEIRRWLHEIAVAPPPSPRTINASVPPELNSICGRAMATDKPDRYQETQEIIDDIECWLVQADVAAHHYSRIEVVGRRIRKHSGMTAVLGLASLLVAAISIGSFVSVSSAKMRTEVALKQMRAERTSRIDDQLTAFVSAPPIQAEVFLEGLESYLEQELNPRIELFAARHRSPSTDKRLRLIHLDLHPDELIQLLTSTDRSDVDELSLLCSAIRSPTNFGRNNVTKHLWQLSDQENTTLTAGTILSRLAPEDPNWRSLAPQLVAQLMSANPQQVTKWSTLLRPVRAWLEQPLMLRYQSDSHSHLDEKNISGQFLFEFFKGEQESLVELVGAADPVMFTNLVEKFREAPDAAKIAIETVLDSVHDPSNFNGPTSLKQAVVNSNGLINDSFMVCDSIPLSQFDALQGELRESGYRPLQVHKYSNVDDRSVATIWIRDDRPFYVSRDLAAADVELMIDQKRMEGWVPDDLSADLVDDRVLYTVVFHQDFADRNVYDVLINNSLDDHRVKSTELGRNRFQQLSYIEIEDAGGALLIAGIYRQDPGQENSVSKAALFNDVDDNNLILLADYVPMHLRRGPRGMTSIWHENRSLHGIIVAEPDVKQKSIRWEALANQGFVPVCIASPTRRMIDSSTAPVSIWHRPTLPESELLNYGMALCQLGDDELIQSWFKRGTDPTLRTLLIHRMIEENISPSRLSRWLDSTQDPGIRSGIIQALGHYGTDQIEDSTLEEIAGTMQRMFEQDPDPGVHGAAAWALTQWGRFKTLATNQFGPDDSRSWFLGENRHTMAVIRGPVSFKMGTKILPTIHAATENFHTRSIDRSFAIATTEVTWEQFKKFSPTMPAGFTRFYSKHDNGKLNQQAPQYQVSWFRAAEYCNWLSKQASLPEHEWCYIPDDNHQYGPGLKVPDNFLERKGYRLPTEAEWEFAARAGTKTPRFYGRDDDMVSFYGWHKKNSKISTHTVGMLKPNELGLFDVYGNVWEWCHGSRDDPWPDFLDEVGDQPSQLPLNDQHPRVLRGGAMVNHSGLLRSSIRSFNRPSNEQFTIGFRVARTLSSPGVVPKK